MLKLVVVQFKLLLNVSNDLFKATNIYGAVRKVGGNLAYKELKQQVKILSVKGFSVVQKAFSKDEHLDNVKITF